MRLQRLFSTSSSKDATLIMSNMFGTPSNNSVGSPQTYNSRRSASSTDTNTAHAGGQSVVKGEITPKSIDIERTFSVEWFQSQTDCRY